ncbi:MAG: hypothetical protein Q4D56_05745 [Bacteroides sp.]|nr:hypothetical protein [Bacteroides sp.]
MNVDILSTSGDVRYSATIRKGSTRNFSLMEEDYILLKFATRDPVHFRLGDYVDDSRFGLFELTEPYKPKYNKTTGAYEYELQLDAYYWKWRNKIFKYLPEQDSQEASWNLTATLDVQMGVFLRNLTALGYDYRGTAFEISIDSTVDNVAHTMSYENTSLLDALWALAEMWECEVWVSDNIIYFGRCEMGDYVDLEQNVNVEQMERSESDTTYATRIYAFGSTNNLPSDYRPAEESVVLNGVVQRRLMLPEGTPYIDARSGMTEEEAVEEVVTFDEIYPRRTGTLSDVSTKTYTTTTENEDGTTTEEEWKAYRFKDTGITFSEEYALAEEELRIKFESGLLNGLEFAVTFNPDGADEKLEDGTWNPEAQVWEIVRNDDYGTDLPSDTIYPTDGDTYVLIGWDSTKIEELGLVAAAEQELKEAAEAYAAETQIDPSTYDCTLMSGWVYGTNPDTGDLDTAYAHTLSAGSRVNLINRGMFEEGNRQSRVIGFELNLEFPWISPVYTIGESASYSRLGSLEEKVDSLTVGGKTFISAGSGTGVYVIGTNDSTPASDRNVYSALRTLSDFLSKKKADKTNFIITFLKGILLGNFSSGVLGSGGCFSIDEETGESYVEADRMLIRKTATFIELVVQRLKHIGGQVIISPASCVISEVVEYEETTTTDEEGNTTTTNNGVPTDVYRCYFETSDGSLKIYNEFEVGDQARCQTFNISEGTTAGATNKYYWRLVTGVGENYIDLSKTDYDTGSSAPEAGDHVSQLGNRSDTTRQNAQIFSAYGDDAPSWKMYDGIDSYSLDGKSTTFFAADGNQVNGVLHIQSGSTGWKNIEGLPEGIEEAMNSVAVGAANLLLNTSFSGDYETEELTADTQLTSESELYSKAMNHWTGSATIQSDDDAVSGRSAIIGSLSQAVTLIADESYVISVKAKGTTLTVSCGDYTSTQTLTEEYTKYVFKLTFSGSGIFMVSGTATVCDIKLERGTVATDWSPSPLDMNKAAAKYQSLSYIYDAIQNGSVDILGGLILSSMIQLGNYKDGVMQQVTAGMSGIYNDGDDVAFWGGGTFEQAIATVMKFRGNLNYQPTDEEWGAMAKFVASHGGDVFLRGYIYALGGYFRGKVEIAGRKILLNTDGSGQLANGNIYWDEYGNLYQRGNFSTVWRIMRDEWDAAGMSIETGGTLSIDFNTGTYLDIIGSGLVGVAQYIDIPSAANYKGFLVTMRTAPASTRSSTVFYVTCGSEGFQVWNSTSKAYETQTTIYLDFGEDYVGTIESADYGDGYKWYASRDFLALETS